MLPPATAVTATGRIRKLSEDEVSLLKRTVAKGTSDDEFAMFLWFCRNHQVDPVAGEVYCIMRWDSKRDVVGKDDEGKPVYQGGMKMTIVMGIGGLRGLAARKHKDYGSTDDPVWEFGTRTTPAKRRIPESVSVAVWKKGAARPTRATIFWDEFAPKDLEKEAWKHDFWNRSPANQLAKCCEAQALRKSYPDLNNIYIPEELAQTDQDYTPSGRQIVTQDGTAPSGKPLTWEAQNRGQLSEEAPHGHPAGSEKARQAEETLRRVEEADRAAREARKPMDWKAQQDANADAQAARDAQTAVPKAKVAQNPPGTPMPASVAGQPILEAETVGPDDFIIRGDIQPVFPMIESLCRWKPDNWWHADLVALQKMQAIQEQMKFQIKVLPSSKPVEKRASPSKQEKKQEEPELVTGTIEQVFAPPNTATPMRQVKILLPDGKKPTFGCFKHDFFAELDKAKGAIEVYVTTTVKGDKTFHNIVRLKRLGKKEWLEDGTPAVQRKDQEAGSRTLLGQ